MSRLLTNVSKSQLFAYRTIINEWNGCNKQPQLFINMKAYNKAGTELPNDVGIHTHHDNLSHHDFWEYYHKRLKDAECITSSHCTYMKQ